MVTALGQSRRRAEQLVAQSELSLVRLAELRGNTSTMLRRARADLKLLADHSDRAIAEISRPRPKSRSGSLQFRRRVDFCDRSTWYLHVRFARRQDAAALASLVAVYQEDADRQALRIGSPSSRDDLIQVAREALILALRRFDPQRRKPFPPYARLTIDGTLRRFLRDQAYAIRPTRRIYELTPRVQAMSDLLTQELGRTPTASELADALGIETFDVLEVIESKQIRSPESLDRPIGEEGYTLAETSGRVDPNLTRAVDRQALRQVMKDLDDDDRAILDEYFVQGRTQQQMADDRGISQMHVSRSLARILRRLRARAGTG
jgi:RNA polymerase sigma-B factor